METLLIMDAMTTASFNVHVPLYCELDLGQRQGGGGRGLPDTEGKGDL